MHRLLSLLDAGLARSFYEQGFWQSETMYARVRHWACVTPGAFALRDCDNRLSWAELLDWVDRLAADLHAAGVRPGQRVSIWLPSRIESVVILLACSRMGYVANTSLHRDYTVADILALLQRAGSVALFAQPGYGADAGRQDIFAAGWAGRMYRVPPLRGEPGNPAARLAALTASAPAAAPASVNPDRVMYLAFTSGTTGLPKGVMHSDNTLLSNGRAIAADWRMGGDTVLYTMSPMSHNMGTIGLVSALACGGELVLHTGPDARRALDRVIETGATYLIGVPTHAIDLLTEVRARGLTRLGAVTGFQLAGAPIPGEVVRTLLRLGVTPQNTFGMTENCSFQYTRPDDPAETIIDSCGRPCAGFELRLWSQEDRNVEAAPGEIGELGGRGACLMLGYFDDQASTEQSFNAAGWFMTGDLGRMDAAGNVTIAGRKKDLIIRGGHNIHPAGIEDKAMRHPAVLKAAAFPVADARLGERMCLAAVLTAPGAISAQDLLAHLDGLGLSVYDMPEYYVELDAFPLTASGKIVKRQLVLDVAEGRLTPLPVRWTRKGDRA